MYLRHPIIARVKKDGFFDIFSCIPFWNFFLKIGWILLVVTFYFRGIVSNTE